MTRSEVQVPHRPPVQEMLFCFGKDIIRSKMALSYYSRPVRLVFVAATALVAVVAVCYSLEASFLLIYKILLAVCSVALLYEVVLSLSLQVVTPELADRIITLIMRTTRRGSLHIYFYAASIVACGLAAYAAFVFRQTSALGSVILLTSAILVIWDKTQSLYMSYVISLIAEDDEKGEKKKK